MPPKLDLQAFTADLAPALAGMTFPAYRHLLALAPALRHPGEVNQKPIQPIGVMARIGAQPIGLALAELPIEGNTQPEILSVFVIPEMRRHGVGTALLERLEEETRARGASRLTAVYMTGRPTIAIMERIFWKRGWAPPATRTITVKFTPEEAAQTPWFGRVRLPAGCEVFSWSDLGPADHAHIRASHERAPWIADGLEPWRHDSYGFDPVSSIGLRYRGEVVGWVINHRVADDVVRFTCSFMRKDLSRRARILPLYSASIERLRGQGCRLCTFVTPVIYKGMVDFVRQRCAPYVGFVGETRGTSKTLLTT
ncbi:MAG: GNAT family N-acetyltransferase [Vicinamibacteria bacterium]|jgi:GNAT superfamily N-acetyltransferase|nr:GNAT family N-acetyltransferase [Vicinamibacteria bacterium]